jgi:hypothetical protein
VLQFVENLPDHDARALVSRLSVANERIGHDVLTKFNPLAIPLAGCARAIGLPLFRAEQPSPF